MRPNKSLHREDDAPISSFVLPAKPPGYVVVVSHDCEFNEQKRKEFLVSRVQQLPPLSEGDLAEALDNNDVFGRHERGLLTHQVDTFVLEPIPGVFEEHRGIVFSSIMPMSMSRFEDLLQQKKAELEHEFRLHLRTKLAWFFTRSAEDVPDGEKSPRPE